MLTGKYEWTLGLLVGVPIAFAILLLLLGGTIVCAVYGRSAPTELEGVEARVAAWTFAVASVVVLVISIVAYLPFNPAREYHAWNEVKGTVDISNSRLIGTGDGAMQERYVVRFKESPTLYGCDDTRCTLATPGKQVRLMCKREYQFSAVSGWACRYGQES